MVNLSTDQHMPLMAHLMELRSRLLRVLLVYCLVTAIMANWADAIFHFLLNPLRDTVLEQGLNRRLIYTGLTEGFLTYLKVALFSGFCLTFPYLATQIWRFMSPGLFAHEKKFLKMILLGTPLLFLLGATFAYYIIFPNACRFFITFESLPQAGTLPIQMEPRVAEYLGFVMRLILAFGISFQLPICLTILGQMGWVTHSHLIKRWRIAVVLIFTVAAFITPPDMLSMVGLALPLVLLYGLSIFMVKITTLKRSQNELSGP